MIKLLSPSKIMGLRRAREWAAISFHDSGLELTSARPSPQGEASVLQQAAASVAPEAAQAEPKARWQGVAQSLRQQVDPQQYRFVTAVGCEDTICQSLSLPTTDPRELQQMLALQIDNLTPLPPEEMVYSFEPLEVADGKTRVLVAIARKNAVNERVEALETAGLPPEVVSVDALAIYHGLLRREVLPRDDKLNALVLLGPMAAHLIIFTNGQPVVIRSIVLNADSLAAAEGQQALREELQRTLVAIEVERARPQIGRATFVVPNDSLRPAAEKVATAWGEGAEFLTNGAAPSTSLSLCLESAMAGEGPHLNLLPEEWRVRRRAAKMRQRLIRGAIAFAALYVLGLVVFFSLIAFRQSQLRGVQAEIKKLRPQHTAARLLHSELVTMRKQLDNKYSALEVLREVSTLMPENVKLNSFVFKKDQSISLRGQAQTAGLVYDFIGKLEKSELFTGVKPGGVRTEGALTKFDIAASLKSATAAPTTAYGAK